MPVQHWLNEGFPETCADLAEADNISSNALAEGIPDCSYKAAPKPCRVFTDSGLGAVRLRGYCRTMYTEGTFGEDGETFGTRVWRVMHMRNTSTVEQMGLQGPYNEDCD